MWRSVACLSLVLTLGAVGGSGAAQSLILSGSGQTSIDSRLYRVDTSNGAISTVFAAQLGHISDIAPNRTDTGFTVAFQGPPQLRLSGLHTLSTLTSGTTLSVTALSNGPTVRCVALTSEDVWLIGTAAASGAGRLQGLSPQSQFFDLQAFPGASIDRILIERERARPVLALNAGGGTLVSYDVFRQTGSVLARGIAPIVDVDQDPYSGTYLVATRDVRAPFVAVTHDGVRSSVRTFRLPTQVFPNGMAVEAVSIVPRGEARNADLWVAAQGQLIKLEWDSVQGTVVYPPQMVAYPLPSGTISAMIVDRGRTELLVRGTHPGGWTLTLRPGASFVGLNYVLLASFAVGPAIPVTPRRMINLAPDPLLFATAAGRWPQIFDDFKGPIGPEGEATGKVNVSPRVRIACFGITIYFAGVILDPGVPSGVRAVTNTVGFVML